MYHVLGTMPVQVKTQGMALPRIYLVTNSDVRTRA